MFVGPWSCKTENLPPLASENDEHHHFRFLGFSPRGRIVERREIKILIAISHIWNWLVFQKPFRRKRMFDTYEKPARCAREKQPCAITRCCHHFPETWCDNVIIFMLHSFDLPISIVSCRHTPGKAETEVTQSVIPIIRDMWLLWARALHQRSWR